MIAHHEFGNALAGSSGFDGTAAEDAGDTNSAKVGSGGQFVLIVEDDFLIAMEAENALSDAGFNVTGVAATAEEALALARDNRPSLVVMDIRLAGPRDGIEAAGDLFRELGLRCVFASAHDDQATRARAEAFAPLGWLTKPYTVGSLITLVRKAANSL